MSLIIGILVGLLLLSLMMFVHELGHYWVGRKLGFTILEFSIFMGPRILSWERKGIRYSLKLIPIGASVRFSGEYRGNEKDQAEDEAALLQPGDFYERPCWARAAVVAAGPLVNIFCAILAFVVLFASLGFAVPALGAVQEESQAALAGLKPGDEILTLDNQPIRNDLDLNGALLFQKPDTPLEITYRRPGTKEIQKAEVVADLIDRPALGITLQTTPEGSRVVAVRPRQNESSENRLQEGDLLLRFGEQSPTPEAAQEFWRANPDKPLPITLIRKGQEQKLSVLPIHQKLPRPLGIRLAREQGIGRAIPRAFTYTWSMTKLTFRSIGKMISGRLSARENLSGPIGVVSTISQVVTARQTVWQDKFFQLLSLFALISLSLGIMNLLPIPPLDGNQLVLTGVEAIRGKPLSLRAQGAITLIGIALLAGLFILGFYFDIARLIG